MFQNSRLIALNDNQVPQCFLGNEVDLNGVYKVYNDGGHYIGTRLVHSKLKRKGGGKEKQAVDFLFESLYYNAVKADYKGKVLVDYIKRGILELFPNFEDIDKFVEKKIFQQKKNLYLRKKRFRRKAYLNKWNFFVTFTYDGKLMTEDEFNKKLRKFLSNLKSRKGWRYMGVFERGGKTDRLHFHALLYVPNGGMIGEIEQVKDYDTKNGKVQITHSNTHIKKYFGKNDFKELNEMELKRGTTILYLLKYLEKSNEKIVYSKGIRSEICIDLKANDFICNMFDYCEKYILFDGIIDWSRDVMAITPTQLSMFDYLSGNNIIS